MNPSTCAVTHRPDGREREGERHEERSGAAAGDKDRKQ